MCVCLCVEVANGTGFKLYGPQPRHNLYISHRIFIGPQGPPQISPSRIECQCLEATSFNALRRLVLLSVL